MATLEAGPLADKCVRIGILTPFQVQEAWDELGSRAAPAEDFLRTMERKGHLTPFQSSKLLKNDNEGYFLGGYKILYKVASGSFGRVFRAQDSGTGRVVALKVLRKKWSEDKHKIELFEREGRMGMSLKHPNIVEILAVNHEKNSNTHYIVMEFVEGGDLRDFLTIRKKLAPLDVLKILEDVTAALAFAFSKGLTHRDMKLTNVLLSSHGAAKLVDFGLAGGSMGIDEDDDDVTVNRTVDYAGLERATGAPDGDPRSDIFFLGCVAYELLCGRPPMERTRNAQARMQAHRFLSITPMKPGEIEGPSSLYRLIENMMSLNPTERIQTCTQLLERIRDVRYEIDGKSRDSSRKSQKTLFIAERDERLQDLLREKLKEKGYRVLIAADPTRAVERVRQTTVDVFIVNAASTGEDGFFAFERVMEDATRQNLPTKGILLLQADDEADWIDKLQNVQRARVMTHPVKFKNLLQTLDELLTQA